MPGATKSSKTINISPVKGAALWRVNFKEGGRLPRELKGSFTSYLAAEQAANKYLARSGK